MQGYETIPSTVCGLGMMTMALPLVRYSNMRIIMLRNGLIIPVHNKDNVRLASQNLWNNQNDVQLNRVISYFKESENKEVFSEKPS